MEQKIFNCPHCNQRLAIDSQTFSNTDLELVCPTCGKNCVLRGDDKNPTSASEENKVPRISFNKSPVPEHGYKKYATPPSLISPASIKPNNPPPNIPPHPHRESNYPPSNIPQSQLSLQSGKTQKRYGFGRLFIFISKIIAVLILLGATTFFALTIYNIRKNYISNRDDIVATYSSSLIEQQEQFAKNYIKVARQMLAANNTQSGISFPDNLHSVEYTFNNELMTFGDVQESLEVLTEYDKKLSVIDKTMQEYFTTPFERLFLKLSSGDAVKISVGRHTPSRIKLTMGQYSKFYERDPTDLLSSLFSNVQELKNNLNKKNIPADDLEIIKSGLKFIETHLNARNKQINIVSQQAAAPKNVTIGEEQFKYEKFLLKTIFKNILKLCSKNDKIELDKDVIYTYVWIISSQHKALRTALYEYGALLEKEEETYKNGIKTAFKSLFYAIVAAFLVVVIADYLEAHLDTACTLQKILSKYPVLFCLILPLIVSGCGKSIEGKLQKQRSQLERDVVNQIFSEQIKQNPNATIFVVPGESLYVISGGVPEHTPFSKPYEIVSFYRAYNAVKLNYKPQVKFGKIVKSKSKSSKYSHKVVMTASLICTLHKDPAVNIVRGVETHGVPPESPASYESWKNAKIANIVPDTYDLAVVVDRLNKFSPESQVTDYRTVSVVLNKQTGIWEIENTDSMPDYVKPPKMPEFQKIKDFQAQHGFKHLVYQDKTQNLYFSVDEWEKANMILNEKRIKFKGVVKPVIVVKHTLELAEYVSTWNNKFTLNEWIKTMENLSNFSQAEFLSSAIKILEDYGRNEILEPLTSTVERMEELLVIYNLLKSNPVIKKVNNGHIISICADIINREVLLTKNTIENISHELRTISASREGIMKCKEVMESDKFLKSDSNLLKHMQILLMLHQLRASRYVPNSYRKYGNIGGHHVFDTCANCNAKGLYICSVCKNNRRCRTCNGKKRVKTIAFDDGWVRNNSRRSQLRFVMQHCKMCRGSGVCRSCNGKRYRCNDCNGVTKIIRHNVVTQGIEEETNYIINRLNARCYEITEKFKN